MSDAAVNGLAGALGGIIAQTLTYPIQTVRLRIWWLACVFFYVLRYLTGFAWSLQVNTRQQNHRVLLQSQATGPAIKSKRPNTLQLMLEIIKAEGVGGLYRGLEPSLVGTACSQGVYYYFYQLFRDHAEAMAATRKRQGSGSGQVDMMTSLVVAALAGCVNVLLTSPIWIVVTRMQTHTQTLTSSCHSSTLRPSASPARLAATPAHTRAHTHTCSEGSSSREEGGAAAAGSEVTQVAAVGGGTDGGHTTGEGGGESSGGKLAAGGGEREGRIGEKGETASESSGREGEDEGWSTAKRSEGEVTWERRSSKVSMVAKEGKGKSKHGVIDTVAELFEEAGLLGFWKGLLPTLVMVANPAIQFMIYETVLARVTAGRTTTAGGRAGGGAKAATAGEIFLVSAMAKIGATLATYPMLVVKSRLQARQPGGSAVRYSGVADAIIKILRYEGIAGFYRGMGTKMAQSVFAASMLFLTKEELVKAARLMLLSRSRVPLPVPEAAGGRQGGVPALSHRRGAGIA